MRLLNVRTFNLRAFNSSNIPKYAIAYHAWAAGGEPTLDDFVQGEEVDRYVYRRVERFAEYVLVHIPDLEWLWIDTCCINRDSVTELYKDLISMPRYYRDAEVCLMHLQDVPSAAHTASLQESACFVQGWTWQDLLTLPVTVSLARNWQFIGHTGRSGRSRSGMAAQTILLLYRRVTAVTEISGTIQQNYGSSRTILPRPSPSVLSRRVPGHVEPSAPPDQDRSKLTVLADRDAFVGVDEVG